MPKRSATARKPALAAASLLAAAALALVAARHAAGVAPIGAVVGAGTGAGVGVGAAKAIAAAGQARRALTEPTGAPRLVVALTAPPAVAPGGSWRVVARVANRAAAPVAGAALTLTWPSTLTLLGATAPLSATAGRLLVSLGPLAGVTTATFAATFTVPSDAAPASRIAATVAARAVGEAGADAAAAVATSRVLPSDLRVEIAGEARDARPSEVVTWTVLAANVAGAPAEDVAVEVALGADLVFVTDTLPAGAVRLARGDSVRWRFGELAEPAVRYIDLVTRVRAGAAAGAQLAPRATITAATGVTRTFDDDAAAPGLPVVVPDLWLSALGPLTVPRGAALSWQLRWGNRGGGRAKDIVVTATLPAGVVLVKTVPSASVAGRTLRWERGAADPEGETPIETLRIEAEVAAGTPALALRLDAAATSLGRDGAPADNAATALTQVTAGPAAWIDVVAPSMLGVGAVRPVQAAVYDGAGVPVVDGTLVRFDTTFGTVSPLEVATTAGRAAAELSAGDAPGAGVVTARTGALAAAASFEVAPAALRLASSMAGPRGPVAQAQVHPGDRLAWVLHVDNGSDSTAEGVRLVAELPDGLTLDGATASRPLTAVGEPRRVGANTEHVWRLADVEPGGALSVTLAPRVDPDAPWTGSDLLFARAEVTTTTAVAQARDLVRIEQLRVFATDLRASVRLDHSASTLRPGGWAVYDIAFSNGQTQTEAPGAVLTSTLPVGTHFDHWQADVGTVVHEQTPFEPGSRVLVWAIDQALSAPGALRLWLRIDADAVPASALVHSVAIGSPVPDIDAGNDARFDSVFLAGIDLRARITGPAEAEPGALAAYRIDIQNAAPHDAATLLTVTADLPPGATVERIDDPGQVTAPGRIRWDFERLGAGASQQVAFDVRLPTDAPIGTVLSLRADALAAEPEGSPADNGATWSTRVVPGPPASITVRAARTDVVACAPDATVLTAAVLDARQRPVADGTGVAWATTAGRLDRSSGVTAGGIATATLEGGPPLGGAIVTARAGPVAGQTVVRLIPGPPASLALGASPLRAPADGAVDLVAHALDGCGNAVADGWPVTFTAERGSFEGGGTAAIVATIHGAARARLFVGPSPGRLAVSAEHGSVRGEAVIDVAAPTAVPPPPRHAIWLPFLVRPREAARQAR